MKKKILLLAIFIIMFSGCLKGSENEYIKIKRTGDWDKISEYYLKEMENEAKKAEKDLEEIYSKHNDEGAVKYIVRSQKSGYLNIFLNIYTNKIIKNCENQKCSDRLVRFYYNLYDDTKDIEIIGRLLDYSDNIDKSEYKKIEEFALNNHSLKAITEKHKKEGLFLEKKYENESFTIKGKEYRVIQKKEEITKEKMEIMLLTEADIETSEENKLYLYIKKNNKEYIAEVSDYMYGFPQLLIISDINNDGIKEIIIEKNPNDLFVFKFSDEKLIKVFSGFKEINFDNYYKINDEIEKLVITIKDDSGYNKKIFKKLPNLMEIQDSKEGIKDESIHYQLIYIKNKIIMRRIGSQNYEIVFDKNLNFKIKAITEKNNELKLSTGYYY